MKTAWRISEDPYEFALRCSILPAMIYTFGPFALDLTKVELRKKGQPLPLEPQVFALLAFLVEHRERLVSKDEIFEKVWYGRIVTDSALASRVKSARRVLGDDGKTQRFIRTIHGQGFRFVAEAHAVRDAAALLQPVNTGKNNSAPPHALPTAADPVGRPSIAVLPFRIIGNAGRYATIADGLPHELITELARLRWLFVIARGSSFRLRADELDLREAGRLLGVRYCLCGTVEVVGRRLTVTAELVDTRGGEIVWAERHAGFVNDVHAVRAEIRSRILSSLEIQIPIHEATNARLLVTDNLDSWSAYHLGLQHMYRFNRRDNALAAAMFERAVTRDPGFARAHAGLSFVHFQTAFLRQTDDIAGEIALARDCAQRGLDIDPLDPFVNCNMGRSFWLQGDLDRAQVWLDRAISLCPNFAQGIYASAWTKTMGGRELEGREQVELAMRLSPLDPLYYAMLATRALTHLFQGEDAEAAIWVERAARSPGSHALISMIAAAVQLLAGSEHRGNAWADNARECGLPLTREDFFRSFPIKSTTMRSRVSSALENLGF